MLETMVAFAFGGILLAIAVNVVPVVLVVVFAWWTGSK